jgi:murein DD-endopeptidase MepM/ murein hydrolase activator NlpD
VVQLIASVLPAPLELQPGACKSVTGGVVGSGVFTWPTVSHKISGEDFSPNMGHMGIDLTAPEDSPVAAVDSGVIVYAGWNYWGYGNMIIIDHRNNWQSLYAHLNVLKVKCGEGVRQGQLIGLAGQTGNAPKPHLHFELWNSSGGRVIKVNPHLYLP